MELRLLAVGDVVGEGGMAFLNRHLRQLKKLKDIHFTVVNGENASGVGITPAQAQTIFDAGADVITLGNHTWNRLQIADYLDECPYILRPANFSPRVPGRGVGVFEGPRGIRIGVINLIGRCELDSNPDNPFTVADQILSREAADVWVVVTDLGMVGPARSVLGIKPDQALNRFLGGLPVRFTEAPGPCKLNSAVFTIDTETSRCLSVERLDLEQ